MTCRLRIGKQTLVQVIDNKEENNKNRGQRGEVAVLSFVVVSGGW
jgi:hypothetical protein